MGNKRDCPGSCRPFRPTDLARSLIVGLDGRKSPRSHGQITEVLGHGVIQHLAQATGISPEALSAKLTEILPVAVNKLTPDGKIPESGMLAQVLNLLKSTPS